MMSIVTRKALNNLIAAVADKELTYEELEKAVQTAGISMTTFRRYAQIEKRVAEIRKEATIQEVLDLLNSCAGDDCYGCEWNYQQIDGKIYNIYFITYYKMIGFQEG